MKVLPAPRALKARPVYSVRRGRAVSSALWGCRVSQDPLGRPAPPALQGLRVS